MGQLDFPRVRRKRRLFHALPQPMPETMPFDEQAPERPNQADVGLREFYRHALTAP